MMSVGAPIQSEQGLDTGTAIYGWVKDLFPICRSLTGNGVRETLAYLQTLLPALKIEAVPSGTRAFDWTVPEEWNIRDAFVADESGERIIDFRRNNLHVVGYSEPVDAKMTFRELEPHLHHLPDQPTAIPYVTSYYQRRWGFCLTDQQYQVLRQRPEAEYQIRIDATLEAGEMNFAELVLPGETDQEVFFSSYVCHPSMANNELSGPCVQVALARWIERALPNRRLTYRFYFGPETIGAITYLSQKLTHLKQKVQAGFVLTCLGDDRNYSYLASRNGSSLADRVAKHVLDYTVDDYRTFSFLDRGSDERQYCSPGVDLPVCTLSRSKYGTYSEYHTSLDNLELISPAGLAGGLQVLTNIVSVLEKNRVIVATELCEPQLGKRGLYPTLSTLETRDIVGRMMNVITYADGTQDLIGIAEQTHNYAGDLIPVVDQLLDVGVLKEQTSGQGDTVG